MNLPTALLVGWLATLAAIVAALALRPRPANPAPPAPADNDRHAATVTALLRPDDPSLPDVDAELIALAVARTVDQYASYLIAVRDGMPAEVVAALREQMYADLRDSLTPPQLARALVIGLHPHADERARALLDTDHLSTEHLES
ncbi:hypothetical protein [Micromonospora tarensis]|uniref:Uncharacterized protein n=1 Tax=Micromonospora tarensis TaxID=2806100 RepID=A0ABS1YCM5_9ACTN|nr:hypothetical protein [Micromonospora tarensis]MBM0275139.1 hypothetical protein [Micromonospora tarensis]